MEQYQAHQRSIVRHFAPHLSNAALTLQERRYFALSLARLALVFALPSCAVFYHHDSFLVTPVFAIVVVVCAIEFVLAMYRYLVLWPEGLRMRWNYWHEIELSEDCYKLKILGHYHRKIAKFAGRFPPSMTSSQIRSYYRTRSALLFALFVVAYVSFLALLVRTPEARVARTWVLYALSVASALVVLRFAKLHLIELPQVLALRIHPEFASDLMPPSAAAPEAIPFARPMPVLYQATDRIVAPIVEVDVEKAQSNYQAAANTMVSPTRALPYEGIDAYWEEQEFQRFRQQARANASPAAYAEFLFGRLLEEDLHLSCRPMLPPNVGELHGVTIQGMCILQIVDIVNIGANFEHRKEDVRGPMRTLKICFTDGHQLVYGFEHRWLPTFSMAILYGTKASGVLVQDVDIRHGLLMLGPQSCRLLGVSGNELLEQQAAKAAFSASESTSVVNAGAYSAALVTAQFTAAAAPLTPRKLSAANPQVRVQSPPGRHPVVPVPAQPQHVSAAATTAVVMASTPGNASYASSSIQTLVSQHSAPGSVQLQQRSASAAATAPPPVFMDVISDEDCDSDMTDPMVEHLFYSPNTPRVPAGSRNQATKSRKRPREAATSAIPVIEPSTAGTNRETRAGADEAHAGANTNDPPSPDDVVIINKEGDSGEPEEAFSFSLLGSTSVHAADTRQFDPSSPFQYFSARSKHLSATDNLVLDEVLHIRACIKSVAGFQFNTGSYLLKVIIEDCTETKEVSVDSQFVERLMGVPCLEFMRAMQATPAVAHGWAAQMQFALMTLEGIMEFRMNPNGTFTLLNCRDFDQQDTKALLQRVRASMAG